MTTNSSDLRGVLRRIAAQASMLFERLEGPYLPAPAPEDQDLIQSRLDEWAGALSAGGKWEGLHRFLAWEGLDMAAAARGVGPVRLSEDAPLPAWAETLGEVLLLAPTGNAADEACFLDPDRPLPFEDLLAPFIHVFRQRLEMRSALATHDLLAAEAQSALERGLLTRLASVAAQTFYVEFQIFRTTGMSPLARFLPQEPDSLYQGFVRRMQAGGLVTFFQKYPVLARVLATLTHLWTEAHVEFLQRLAADLPEIARVFGDGRGGAADRPSRHAENGLGKVRNLEPALSDPHRGGRGAVALTFESGLRLVYKPKDLGTEAAYNDLLAWLNERGAPLDMKALRVSNQASHGWVEFAEHEPCADKAAVARYYQRAGALLCLVYVLESIDCHAENLVASGEYPVLIDNETLLHHRVRLAEEDPRASAQLQAHERLGHSVLRTGLLPGWQMDRDGRGVYDVSGLGGYAEQVLPYHALRWTHVNTDRMTLAYEPVKLPPQPNIPHLNGAPVRLDEHVGAVMEGFATMYRFLLAQREPLLAPGGPLEAFKGQPVRFVFRPTRVYTLILKRALQPRYLRDGVEYSIPLEMLARAHLLTEEKPPNWPILRAERSAMQQLDIPIFTAQVDDDTLVLGPGKEIPGYFAGPSFDLAVEGLQSLDEADLAEQLDLIQAALHIRVAGGGRRVLPEDRPGPVAPDVAPLSPEALVAQAVALAQGLEARAIRGADGSATWIAPLYMPEAERFQLGHLGLDLYDGLAGVALFLAALESIQPIAGDLLIGGYRELCLAALQPARKELREARTDGRILQWLGIGGAAGLGSVLYALVRVARLLDEPALLEEATTAARLLTPDRIAADETLDVVGGAAGAILGLLALHEASRDATALERAVDCGRHLMATRAPSAAGPRAWPTIGARLLTGFAHGAAGIAYALLRLYAVTGEADFRAAAEEAIAYEGSVFVEPEGNWPDLRPSETGAEPVADNPRFAAAWCHGAPGIGLARLGGLPWLDTPAIRRDVEAALATTQRVLVDQHHEADHVCCGNMGRIEVLLVAGERLAYPEPVAAARRQASRVVARAEQSGGYRLSAVLPRGVYSPGFFQGAAGVGYGLLRLAYPDRLPSVLLWE